MIATSLPQPKMASLKRLLVGSPIRTERLTHERLTKKTALAIFASDALSSTAYATEQILLVLAAAYVAGQADAFSRVVPISIAIGALLVIVAISYRQTIHAYPSGGGAYIVAKENLGTLPGLIAGASLLVDYVLTVSVSIAAGVEAITSAMVGTRFAGLHNHRVWLCLFFIAFIAIANLRGVREAGSLFAAPSYAFIFSFLCLIVYGLVRYYMNPGIVPLPNDVDLKIAEGYHAQPLHLLLLLGAFANGCAALTGIEAISNGVQAFKQPESRNAAATLSWMAFLLIVMFFGASFLAHLFNIHPSEHETVISQIARIVFTGHVGWFYYVVQATTAAILVLAANTSFAGFPRLSSLLARDRFLPRQLANLGDRLVFSNGIVLLAVFSGILVWAFRGDTSRLIPLYAVGVFLSFTLSQAGMIVHWRREGTALRSMRAAVQVAGSQVDNLAKGSAQSESNLTGKLQAKRLTAEAPMSLAEVTQLEKKSHWRKSLAINGVGAVSTFIVLMVFIVTKFLHGAWIVVVLIPLLVVMFLRIHRHYFEVAQQLSTEGLEALRPIRHEVIVPISGLHRGVIAALEYAKSIAPHHVTAIYVNLDDETTQKLREKWQQWGSGVNLVVVASPYRSLLRPLLNYVDRVKRSSHGEVVTIVLPEFVPARWWQNLLHNQNTLFLKGALLFKRGVVVTNVPYHLEH
ncbi:MAG: amino acid permease [Acidobacteria bacterium]|nr:MAG: amino acid permease [Acidobacteriota bacterium]